MKPCSAVETRLPSKQKIVGSIPTRVMVFVWFSYMVSWFYGFMGYGFMVSCFLYIFFRISKIHEKGGRQSKLVSY